MATMLETPSRIWRRIEAVEDKDMPSLPSLSSSSFELEDSVDAETVKHLNYNQEDEPVTPQHDYDDQFKEVKDPVAPHQDYDDQFQEDEVTPHHDYDDQFQEDEDLVTPHHDYHEQLQEDEEDLVTHHHDYDDQLQEDGDPVTPHHNYDDQLQEHEEDPVTPHTRRRSFLLDVINSTARPRMKFPTPHPRKFDITDSTPRPRVSSGGPSSPGLSLQSALKGVTYRRPRMVPTRRMSHPLSQMISASSHETSESDASPISGRNPVPRATPSLTSPYDGTSDRASFISTASSHDLTTHHRVNTSFDPAMGFGAGAPGHGVGRFNAAKLNNYLHGLNRRLQQENENLIEKLNVLEEEKRGEGASRRMSIVPTSLDNVQEDLAEGWLEERAELGDMVEKFRTELTTCMAEKKEVETALEQEKESRERDKERWRERMTEVEQGVSGIIAGLEQKLQAAEKQNKKVEEEASQRIKEMEKELEEICEDRDVDMERASKAERIIAGLEQRLQAAEKQNKRVEEEASQRVKEVEKELEEICGDRDVAMERASNAERIIAGLEQKLQAADKQNKRVEEEASQREKELEEICGDRDVAMEQASNAERIIAGLERKLQAADKQNERVEEEASQRAKEMEKEFVELHGDRDVAMERAFKAERIVAGLERKLQAAEKQNKRVEEEASKEMEKELVEIRGDLDVAMERAFKAERIIAGLEQKLHAAEKQNKRVEEEASKGIEKELVEIRGDRDVAMERAFKAERIVAGLEQKLHAAEKHNKRVEEEASKGIEKELVELRGDRDIAMERAFKAERIIAGLEQKLHAAEKQTKKAEEEASRRVKEMAKELIEIRGDARTVAGLEADLKRVRRDAEAFGQDLKFLRIENDNLKSKKQAQAQVRLLNEQLEMEKENVLKARGEIKNYICAAYVYGFGNINDFRLTTFGIGTNVRYPR